MVVTGAVVLVFWRRLIGGSHQDSHSRLLLHPESGSISKCIIHSDHNSGLLPRVQSHQHWPGTANSPKVPPDRGSVSWQ